MANTSEQVAEKNKHLQVFLGKWHTIGEMYDKDGSSTGKIDATDTYEWLPGEYALIHYTDSSMGGNQMRGIEIIGYNPLRKKYFTPFFDDQGGAGWEELSRDGDTWTWHGEKVMGVRYHRCKAVFVDSDTITALHEFSDDDKHWLKWMSITLTRMPTPKSQHSRRV